MTAHAGLLPLITFMTEELQLPQRLRSAVGWVGRARTHPVHLVLFAFIAAALAGIERMAHLECLDNDPVLIKFLRLAYWPVRKVFAKALELSDRAVEALVELVSQEGLATLRLGTTSVVIDFDNTAIVDHGTAEGSRFGYCGKGRRRRRHYPMIASVAETRAIVLARYRGGDGLGAEEFIEFMAETFRRVHDHLGSDCEIVVRGDAGLWCPRVGYWLRDQGVAFVMATPMSPGIKLYLHKTEFSADTDDDDIEFGSLAGELVGAGTGFCVALIRRKVHDPKAPPQGKRVDGYARWRFQAVVSDRAWEPVDLWRFYNGRADCERVFRVGKQALALGKLVSRTYRANETAFLLRSLAFNVDLRFQAHCERLARLTRRPLHQVGLEWRQPRFYCSPGRLLNISGRLVLRVPKNRMMERLWEFYAPGLIIAGGVEA